MVKFRLKELIAGKERTMGQRITYEAIAEATGLSPNTLSTVANNKVKKIGVETIQKLCEFLECKPGDLIVLQD